jgi:CBS domain-containing protein/sporulation protein YlmC with PRC-barrel domain
MLELYLSDLIGKKVYDAQGNSLGRVRDLVAEITPSVQLAEEDITGPLVLVDTIDQAAERVLPAIKGIVVRKGNKNEQFYLPIDHVGSLSPRVMLASALHAELQPFDGRRAGEILLARDLWDKQVIDLEQRRVVRVNDVVLFEHILPMPGDDEHPVTSPRWWVRGVDVGFGGIARRLRISRFVQALTSQPLRSRVVRWNYIDVFGSKEPGGVAVRHKKLANLHPAEIARITDSVSYLQGAEIVAALEDTLAADTLEEITDERRADIVEQIPEDRAAHILEEMAPDEASDLLADLPEPKANSLLEHMEDDEAQPVRQLMRYPENTAGGIMTNEFVRVLPDATVEEVIEANRYSFATADLIYYMFVIDAEDTNKLVGIITVRDLLVQPRNCPVKEFMLRDFTSVRPGENKKEAARKMAEYNLIALPVVDATGTLHGVVTVDDALEALLPEGWKKRLPKVFS